MKVNSSVYFLFFVMFSSVFFSGCTTVSMPQYLEMEHPYQRQFSATYEQVLSAAEDALGRHGWRIDRRESPYIADNINDSDSRGRQVVLFTRIKQKALFLASRYSALNVIIKEQDQGVNVQIVYFSVLSTAFRNVETYKNDDLVNKIFESMQLSLN